MMTAKKFQHFDDTTKLMKESAIVNDDLPVVDLSHGGTSSALTASLGSLVYSGATALALLATAASGVLVTDISGMPSISTDIPTAVTIGGGYIYRSGGMDVPVSDGGTGKSSWTANGVLYASDANTLTNGSALTYASSTLTSPKLVLTDTTDCATDYSTPPSLYTPGGITATKQIWSGTTIRCGTSLGVGVTATETLSTTIAMGGTTTRSIGVNRNTAVGGSGQSLTLIAGGATSGSTDRPGGELILRTGLGTGVGTPANCTWQGYVVESTGAIASVATTPTDGGVGYTALDVLTVFDGTGGTATVRVDSVDGSGSVTAITLLSGGTSGYSVATGVATTGGTGVDCKISITAITSTVDQSLVTFMRYVGVNRRFGINTTAASYTADIVGAVGYPDSSGHAASLGVRSQGTGGRRVILAVDDTNSLCRITSSFSSAGAYPFGFFFGTSDYGRLGTTGLSLYPANVSLASEARIHVFETSTSALRGVLVEQNNSGTQGAKCNFRKSRGTSAARTTVATGDTIGRIAGWGYDGTNFLEMGAIDIIASGTIGTGRVPTQLDFYTGTDAATSVLTKAVSITNAQVLSVLGTTNVTAANTGIFQSAGGGYFAGRIASAMSVLAGALYSPYGIGFNTSKAVYAGETNVINNNVLLFDGTSDYVNAGDLTELNSVSAFTLAMTVSWNDLTNPAANKVLFIKQVDTSNRVYFYHSTAGLLIMTVRNADTSVASINISSLPIVVGRDHRLVFKFDGSGLANADRFKLIFDDVEQTLSFTGTIPTTTANLVGASAYISYSSTNSWNGSIKRSKLWTSALSSSDITLDNQGSDVGSPVHYWKINEGSGTAISDYGSNPMNGTLTGGTWSTSNRMGLGVPFPRTLISLPAQTTREYGLNWGNDVWLYRSAVATLYLQGSLQSSAQIWGATGKFGDTTNYSEFETDGTYKANGSATTFNDINFKLISAKVPAANAPTWAATGSGHYAYRFAVNDYLDLGCEELLHDWKEGSNIEIHVHWETNGANDATVRYVKWEISYSIANTQSAGGTTAFPVWTVVSAESTIAASEPDATFKYTSVLTITPTGFKIGAGVKLRLRRITASSTAPANDPFAQQVGIHYEKDTLGSRSQTSK